MKEIPDGMVDLTVTSPPYDNLRTYNNTLEWGDHVWKPVLEQLFRVTKDGGVAVWVVNDATIKGSETGTSFRQALYAKEIGFNLHDTMIWNKGGFTGVGSTSVRYGPSIEFMFIFSKGRVNTFNPIKDRLNKNPGKPCRSNSVRLPNGNTIKKTHRSNIIGEYGIRFCVWDVTPEMSSTNRFHPAQFPLSLAQDHILSWSNENDVVLDPFLGSGTTGLACVNLNRRFIGIEKDESYYNIAKERIAKAIEGRTNDTTN
jgi:site-specific DNA-methyltransferase (adenine-specific)